MRKSTLWITILLVLTLLAAGTVNANEYADEDWDEIIRLAKEEGELVAYAPTSRLAIAAQAFEEKYGIKVTTHQLSEVEMIERTYREAVTGINQVDLVLIEDLPSMYELLIKPGHLINYVPPAAREAVPPEHQNPLVFVYQPRVIGYNTEVYEEEPIESIWELTLPKWRGKVLMRDLAITGEHQNFFAELVRRSHELEAEYERFFGEPLVLTEENAGLEFMKRLIQNDLVIMTSDTRISEAVGARGQTDPPIGFIYVYSHHRHKEAKDLALEAMENVKPFSGYSYGMFIQIAAKAPHPNAAKLFANFLNTPEGYEAWHNGVGFYSMNKNIDPPEDGHRDSWDWWAERVWSYDVEFATQNRGYILDAWMRFMNY
ncbi:MAG TPA: ABC transporter substrate-binding protein [Limnochordia bacterium]|nr:ABC transporter substrate-binding protein [Limnochordia bacterium]